VNVRTMVGMAPGHIETIEKVQPGPVWVHSLLANVF